MRQHICRGLILIAVLTLGSGVSSFAGPFEDATAAYQHGDYATALKLIRPLADHGNAQAQFQLGSMYANGQGVPKDYKETVKWYRLAADQGYAAAQNGLGAKYDNGQGVQKNKAEAAKWYRLAAYQGFALAQFHLGAMYASGEGVPQDNVRAYMWVNLAASSLSGEAGKAAADTRTKVAAKMTPQQVAAAGTLAQKCQQSKFKQCD